MKLEVLERQEIPPPAPGLLSRKGVEGRAVLGPSNDFDSIAMTGEHYSIKRHLSRGLEGQFEGVRLGVDRVEKVGLRSVRGAVQPSPLFALYTKRSITVLDSQGDIVLRWLGLKAIDRRGKRGVLEADHMVSAVNAHCRTLSAHDKEGWLNLWAEDAVLEDPVGVDTYRGKHVLATTFWGLIQELCPMKLWLERDVIVCGNEAIGLLHGVVTRDGKLTKVGPIVDHFIFNEDGKIASMRAFWKYA